MRKKLDLPAKTQVTALKEDPNNLPDKSTLDRHRGGGHPPTPATPPCVRVRTRRFEMVTLVHILQIRESERFEIGGGKLDG